MCFLFCFQELFQPLELQAMVVGNDHYDWDQLEKVYIQYCVENKNNCDHLCLLFLIVGRPCIEEQCYLGLVVCSRLCPIALQRAASNRHCPKFGKFLTGRSKDF